MTSVGRLPANRSEGVRKRSHHAPGLRHCGVWGIVLSFQCRECIRGFRYEKGSLQMSWNVTNDAAELLNPFQRNHLNEWVHEITSESAHAISVLA